MRMIKKSLALVLALGVIVTSLAGVNLTVFAQTGILSSGEEIRVKSFTVSDCTVLDGANGSYRDYNGSDGTFYTDIRPSFTVELENGEVLHSGKNGVEIDGNTYDLYYSFEDGASLTDPGVGTHPAVASFMGLKDDFNVTVLENPVASVDITDLTLVEYTGGYYAESYYYYTHGTKLFYIYELRPEFTVTLKDGRQIASQNAAVEIDGFVCDALGFSVNQFAYPFLPGETYGAVGYFMGCSDSFEVTVQKNDFAGTCGDRLTWELDNAGTLTIRGTGDMHRYWFESEVPWYSKRDSIKKVIIEEGVTSIGDYAFFHCANLADITIPEGVTAIGDYAFSHCESLTSIDLPDSISSIDFDAFLFCSGLTEITIPNSMKTIRYATFVFCTGLTKVIIPDSVTCIESYAFDTCTGLTDIYYMGSEEQWNQVDFRQEGNNYFRIATLHYDYVPPHVHAFGEWQVRTPATCMENGVKYRVCECGEEETDTLPATGHDYDATVTAPTCTEKGYTTYTCKVCGDSYTGNETEAAGHDYKAAVTAPTCTEKGYTTYTCKACGDHYVDHYVNASAHNWGAWSVTKAATCTESGKQTRICKNDKSHKETKTIAAKGHKLTPVAGKAATTKAAGNKAYYKCASCGKLFTDKAGKNETTLAKVTIAKLKVYTITYKLDGGTNNKSNPKTYDVTKTFTLKNPTKKGYTFKGWYSDAKFKNKVTKIAKNSTGNKTLYAKWAKNTYKITYKLNGGKNSKSNPKTYTVTTKTVTLKKPTKKGYTFVGWYSDAKCKKKVTKIAKGSTGNKTLYAKWKKK